MTIDAGTAAQRYLADSGSLTDLLGSDDVYGSWVFRGLDETTEPYIIMEGTSASCVLVWIQGGWTGSNMHNTEQFPQLNVEVYTDPQRDYNGNVVSKDVMSVFLPIWDQIDLLLHRPQGGSVMFDELRVNSSFRSGEWSIFPYTDTDGVQVSRNTYQLAVG